MNQSGWLAVHVSQGFKVECCSLPHIGGWESPHDASEISCEKNPPGAFGLRSPWLLTTHSQVSGWSSLRIDTSKECPSESLVISVPDMKHRDVSWDHSNWAMDILDKGILQPTSIQNNYLYRGYHPQFLIYIPPLLWGPTSPLKKRPVGAILRQRCRFGSFFSRVFGSLFGRGGVLFEGLASLSSRSLRDGWLEKQIDCFWRGVS